MQGKAINKADIAYIYIVSNFCSGISMVTINVFHGGLLTMVV